MKTNRATISTLFIILAGSVLFLAGCQVVQGIGKGVQKTGEKIEEVGRDTKSNPDHDGAIYDLNE